MRMQDNPRKEILNNLRSLGIGDLSSRILALAAFFYTVRILGPEKLGLISYASSVTALFLPVIDYGLGFIGTREVSKNMSLLHLYVRSIILCRISLWFLSTFALILFLSLSNLSGETQRIILLYQLTIIPFVFSMTWACQGIGKTGWFIFDKNMQSFLYLVGIILFIPSATHYDRLPILQTFAGMIPALIIVWYLLSKSKNESQRFDPHHAVKLLQSSFVLFIPVLISQINVPLTLLVVKQSTSLEEVGLFSVSIRVMILFSLFPNLLWSAYYPVISKHTSSDQLRGMGFVLYKYSILIGIVPALLGFTYARELIDLLFGPDYKEAFVSFRIFSLVTLLQSLFIVFTRIMPAIGMESLFRKLIVIETAAQLAAAFVLINTIGLNGAAYSFLIIDLVIVFITLRIMKGRMNIQLLKAPVFALGILLLSVMMSEYCKYLFHMSFIIMLGMCLFLYLVFAIVTSMITLKDFAV